tara:strand:- start:21 stop:212 length:192 start_codon:yes stop_codon:yes gene_type:complete
MSGKHGAGKGSRYRPVDQKKYDENWEKCFGKKKKNPNKGLMQPGGIIDYTDIPPSTKTQGDKQ